MYYKVIYNGRVIDVLTHLVFLKYQPRNQVMLRCTEAEAEAILSSDRKHIWHEETLFRLPVDGYDTVRVEPIDQYEYEQLLALNGKTPQDIIDAYTLSLLDEGVL